MILEGLALYAAMTGGSAVVAGLVSFVTGRRFGPIREKIVEVKEPQRCEYCHLLILGRDMQELDIYTHTACIVEAQNRLAELRAKRDAENKRKEEEAKALAERSKKIPSYLYETTLVTSKDTSTGNYSWAWDNDSKTYYRYTWQVLNGDGHMVDSGSERHEPDAVRAAKAIIKLHKKAGTSQVA